MLFFPWFLDIIVRIVYNINKIIGIVFTKKTEWEIMRNESVAILDIRSNEVSFSLGSKGVNGTFVFNDTHAARYEGYLSNGFLDVASFRRAVTSVVTAVQQRYVGVVSGVYVSVPSAFVTVQTMGHTISFPTKRKISAQDVDALFESGLNELMAKERCVRRSAMYFALGDNRKYFSAETLYGVSTNTLKGALCYYFVEENFTQTVTACLSELGFTSIKFIPSTLAQADYLLPKKKREGYAYLLDLGFLTTSVSVLYGDGIVHEETFDFGTGTILVAIMEGLGVEYSIAEEILASANISGGAVPREMLWTAEQGDVSFSVMEINDIIKCSLDGLCEEVDGFFSRYYKDKNAAALMANPISLTGEGIVSCKGAAEHISRRLNRMTEIVSPDLPYYDKPIFSSRISLLNMSTQEVVKNSFIQRIFNVFGGKKK